MIPVVPWLSSKAILWIAAVVLFLLACGGSFVWGIRVESNSRDAAEKVLIESMHKAYVAKIAEHRAIAQSVQKELTDANARRVYDEIAFRDELRRAVAERKPLATCPKPRTAAPTLVHAPPSAPPVIKPNGAMPFPEPPPEPDIAEPRFTYEFARLYDLANAVGGVPGAGNPGPVDAAATQAGTVGAATVLAVHGENAAAWSECRAQLTGWQALARRHGWVQ